jgi:hypothetical protein
MSACKLSLEDIRYVFKNLVTQWNHPLIKKKWVELKSNHTQEEIITLLNKNVDNDNIINLIKVLYKEIKNAHECEKELTKLIDSLKETQKELATQTTPEKSDRKHKALDKVIGGIKGLFTSKPDFFKKMSFKSPLNFNFNFNKTKKRIESNEKHQKENYREKEQKPKPKVEDKAESKYIVEKNEKPQKENESSKELKPKKELSKETKSNDSSTMSSSTKSMSSSHKTAKRTGERTGERTGDRTGYRTGESVYTGNSKRNQGYSKYRNINYDKYCETHRSDPKCKLCVLDQYNPNCSTCKKPYYQSDINKCAIRLSRDVNCLDPKNLYNPYCTICFTGPKDPQTIRECEKFKQSVTPKSTPTSTVSNPINSNQPRDVLEQTKAVQSEVNKAFNIIKNNKLYCTDEEKYITFKQTNGNGKILYPMKINGMICYREGIKGDKCAT